MVECIHEGLLRRKRYTGVEIRLITSETLRELQSEFYHGVALFKEVNGTHFEQLLK